MNRIFYKERVCLEKKKISPFMIKLNLQSYATKENRFNLGALKLLKIGSREDSVPYTSVSA